MVTTSYAALVRNSTPDNCQYVRRNGRIIGAIIRRYDGRWMAYAADAILDLRDALECPNRTAAIAAVLDLEGKARACKPRVFFWDGAWHCSGGAAWSAHLAGCDIADRLNRCA